MHEQLMENLARFMARHDLVEAALTEHRCDAHGRCTCSTPNVDRPWPCTSQLAAEQARYLQELRMAAAGRRRV